MTTTGDPQDGSGADLPRDDDAITDEAWPEDGGELPPPPEVAEPEFDDLGDGGDYEGEQGKQGQQDR